jgi:hypothetical protein
MTCEINTFYIIVHVDKPYNSSWPRREKTDHILTTE